MGDISESGGTRADYALLCPVCCRVCDGSWEDCRVIPPAVRRSRIKDNRQLRAVMRSMKDDDLFELQDDDFFELEDERLYELRMQAFLIERHDMQHAMPALKRRWAVQRTHLDLIEITELEPDPHVAYMAMIELDPGEPPPRVESSGLIDINTIICAPRPGPHSGVVLAVG